MPRPYSTGMRGKSLAQLNREIADVLARRPPPQEQPSTQCYACDDEATGLRDRRREGGRIEAACGRHADPTISHPQGPQGHGSSHSSITPGVVHVIQGNYRHGHGWEDLTAETSRDEALARLREYRDNEPGTPFRRIRRHEPDEKKPRRKAGTSGGSTRARRAHATRAAGSEGTGRTPGLDAYRRLIGKAIERCSKHPRQNHSLYECVFREIHDGMPYPTPQMQRILESAVHAARPVSNFHATRKTAGKDVTVTQIRDLRREAVSAGDHAQALLCDLALGNVDPDAIDTLRVSSFLSPSERRRIAAMDPEDYRQACERAIQHAHARKKKLDPHTAKQRLKAAGIDFSRDFHQLPSSQVQIILDTARAAGYRKRKDAPGSTARMYYQYLSKIR